MIVLVGKVLTLSVQTIQIILMTSCTSSISAKNNIFCKIKYFVAMVFSVIQMENQYLNTLATVDTSLLSTITYRCRTKAQPWSLCITSRESQYKCKMLKQYTTACMHYTSIIRQRPEKIFLLTMS